MIDIQADLDKIRAQIQSMRQEIKNDYARRGLLHSGFPDKEIFDNSMRILEDELTVVILQHGYSKRKYKKQILQFIDGQTSYIIDNIQHEKQKEASKEIIQAEGEKVKRRILNKHRSASSAKRQEWIKFWIPITISILALAVSVYGALYARTRDSHTTQPSAAIENSDE